MHYQSQTNSRESRLSISQRAVCRVLRLVAVALGLLTTLPVIAGGTFHVFAPDSKGQQVICLSVNATSDGVTIKQQESFSVPFGPSAIAMHPSGKRLVVGSSSKDGTAVATVEIETGGKLSGLQASKLSHPSGYTSVDRSGRYFLTVDYRSGTIAVYEFGKSGSVGPETCTLDSPNEEAHCILTTPDNRFVYIPSVKLNNALHQFAFDAESGQLRPLEPFNASPPAMFGPRHVAYHPTLPLAYFSNEQQLGVSVYEIGPSGQLADMQHATTMPRRTPFEQGKRDLHASDLAITSDGKMLYVAVRDFAGDEDSVFSFRVETDGRLSQLQRTLVGDIPWKLDLSPDDHYLLVSETGDHRLLILETHHDGTLSPAAHIDWGIAARDMVVAEP
ncbi:MAG: lactonase family protein [Rubripirellula sp.]